MKALIRKDLPYMFRKLDVQDGGQDMIYTGWQHTANNNYGLIPVGELIRIAAHRAAYRKEYHDK